MIGARFQHGGLMGVFQLEQGQRHADVVVETGFAPERPFCLAQHRGINSLVVVLPLEPPTAMTGRPKSRPVTRPQSAQGPPGVVHRDDRAAGKVGGQFVPLGHDGRHARAAPLRAGNGARQNARPPGRKINRPVRARRESVQTRATVSAGEPWRSSPWQRRQYN